MSYNGKSKVAKMLLYAAVTRLDGLRTKSFDGDNDKCRPFPEWYIENQLWFLNQFEQIKEYMNRYNETKETKEDIITMSQPYDIRGGKTKKKYTIIKDSLLGNLLLEFLGVINELPRSRSTQMKHFMPTMNKGLRKLVKKYK